MDLLLLGLRIFCSDLLNKAKRLDHGEYLTSASFIADEAEIGFIGNWYNSQDFGVAG